MKLGQVRARKEPLEDLPLSCDFILLFILHFMFIFRFILKAQNSQPSRHRMGFSLELGKTPNVFKNQEKLSLN